MNAISFCIIATGKHEESLSATIKSIQTQDIPNFEILVCGIAAKRHGTQLFSKPEWIQQGEFNKIRNFLCNKAKYKIIVLLSDSILLDDDWYKNIREEDNFDIATCKVVDLNNKRYFDWAKHPQKGKKKFFSLLHYEEWHPDVCIGGEFMILRREIFKNIRFDEKTIATKKHIAADFCHKASNLGYKIRVLPKALAVYQGYSKILSSCTEKKDTTLSASHFYTLGLFFFREDEYNEAILLLKIAEKIIPSILTKYNIGLSYFRLNNLQEAKHWFNLVIDTYNEENLTDVNEISRYSQTFFHLGKIALAEGNVKIAAEFFYKILQKVEEHSKAKVLLEAITVATDLKIIE